MHGHFDWGVGFYGILAIAVGLGFALSSRFSSFFFKYDGKGAVWSSLLGGGVSTRYIVSGVAILVGGEINALLEDAAAKRGVRGAKRRGQRSLGETCDRRNGDAP